MKIVAIYARKSLFTGKGDSIGAQIDICKKFIDFKFANTEYEIKIFEDEGYSGKTTDRPAFSNMMDLVRNKKIDYIITYKLDRLGRTARDLHNLLYEFDKLGVTYLSATEPFETTTSTGRFMISVLAAMAEMERERLAERVKLGMIQLAKKGRWLGGQPPLGFNSKREIYFDENGKQRHLIKLIPNHKELKKVKIIYTKYLELGSMTQVRKYCIENSIKGKNGGDMSTSTLKRILSSPIYVCSSPEVANYLKNQGINVFGPFNGNGMLTFNKTKDIKIERKKSEWIAATSNHKGIIKDTVWLQAQYQLEKQSEKRIKVSGRQGTSSALLSGILKCSKCGSNMVVKTGHRSKKNPEITYSYYVCNKKNDSYGTKCNNTNIRVDEADEAVIKKIKLLNKDLLKENLKENLKDSINHNNNIILNNIDVFKKNIQYNEKAISNLVDKLSLIKNENTSNIIINKITTLNEEIDDLNLKLEEEKIKLNKISQTDINIDDYIHCLKNFNDKIDLVEDIHQRKMLLNSVISSIEWDGKILNITPMLNQKN